MCQLVNWVRLCNRRSALGIVADTRSAARSSSEKPDPRYEGNAHI